MPLATVAAIDPQLAMTRVTQDLVDLPCSRLDVSDLGDRAIRVRGRVAEAADVGRVASVVRARGAMPALDLEVVAAPFCLVLNVVEGFADTLAAPPRPQLNHADGLYRDGDYLVARVAVPDDLARAALHVVFVDHLGKVVHLLPNPSSPSPLVDGGQTVVLGVESVDRRKGVRDYRIGPPFGPGMILAILSPAPLPGVGTLEVETLSSFLQALETAMAAIAPARVRLARLALDTRP